MIKNENAFFYIQTNKIQKNAFLFSALDDWLLQVCHIFQMELSPRK